ncbi:hypothetical protein FH972_021029 [Carpinus fangiana]|uniref:Uncharacterized protein n=1 Tax=Carpinus fangiana TaxID=176857 RepID=A0A5N6KNS1_9ROSI|nr:hypothetical protein FH972_021029 [Carpinus fangiana]
MNYFQAFSIAALIQFLLAICAALGMLKLARRNGLFNIIEAELASPKPLLPNTKIAANTHWTGIAGLDSFLSLMVMFFTPILDRRNISLYVQGLHFYGLLMAGWILVFVESFRFANAGLALSYAGLAGLLMELGGFGLFLPLWCLLHITTSPLALGPEVYAQPNATALMDLHDLKAIPWALLLGAGVPGAMILSTKLPYTSPGLRSKQLWILIRIFHPVFTTLAHRILKQVTSAPDAMFAPPMQQKEAVLEGLRSIYKVATFISAVPHLAVLAVVLLAYFSPAFIRNETRKALKLSAIWTPAPFWTSNIPKISGLVEGISIFLTWDELVAAASIVAWAFAINRNSTANSKDVRELPLALLHTAFLSVVLGPAGAAVSLIRERDETFFHV